MKEKEKEEKDDEFKEEIIIEKPIVLKTQPRKLNSKLIGKKKVLLRSAPPAPKQDHKKSNAEFLIDSIVKTFWTSKWKEQIIIMKYSRVGFNKKRGDFRNLCMKLNHAMKYHQYLYLTRLFDNMEKLPVRPGVVHDDSYGKLKLVYNENKNVIKEKKEDNMIYDDNGKVEIKIDIPEIVEVEYNPGEEQIKEKDIKENIIEDKTEIKIDSPPKLLNLNKKGKKILIKKEFDNNNNDDNKINNEKIDNNNKETVHTKKEEVINPIKIEIEEENNKNEILLKDNKNNIDDNFKIDITNKDKNIKIENNLYEDNKTSEPINKELLIEIKTDKETPKVEKKLQNEEIKNEDKIQNINKIVNPLSKKIKRIKEKYLGDEEKNKRSKNDRHSVITIRNKEELEIDEDDNINNKKKRGRRMSDFFTEYDEERISKSKRLQYKLKRLKKNTE